jgi:hypothetical protein
MSVGVSRKGIWATSDTKMDALDDSATRAKVIVPSEKEISFLSIFQELLVLSTATEDIFEV